MRILEMERSMNSENSTTFRDISRKRVYLEIMDQIMEKIQRKEIRPGDRLPPERQWAEELGVSRATVREAIRSMEMIGLVSCRQGEGNFINDDFSYAMAQPMTISFWLSDGGTQDVHEFRQCLEIESAKLAAKRATREQIKGLAAINRRMSLESDEAEGAMLDKAFHHEIAVIADNSLIRNALSSVTLLIDTVIRETRTAILTQQKDFEAIVFQHERIIEAISYKNPDLAAKRMLEHMLYVEDFIKILERSRLPEEEMDAEGTPSITKE